MVLKTCLGLFSLRGGTIFAGFMAALSGMYVFQMCVSIIAAVAMHQGSSSSGPFWFLLSVTFYAAGLFLSSVLALVGVHKNRPRRLVPFLVFLVLNVILIVAFFIFITVHATFVSIYFFYTIDGVVSNVYFFFVVYAYACHVRRTGGDEGVAMTNNAHRV